jgi:plasmid replication initiation protein
MADLVLVKSEHQPLKDKTIRQHNDFTQARYNLTSLEQNIVMLLIAKIKTDDPDKTNYIISSTEIFYNQTQRSAAANTALLKECVNKLLKRVVTIQSANGNRIDTHFVSSCEYLDGKGSIELSFDPKLRPFLTDLKSNFTQYSLRSVLSFKGKYTKRIYQLISQYQDTKVLYISLNHLIEILRLRDDDQKDSKKPWYELYGSFKQRVIKPALAEINESPDSQYYIYEIFETKKSRKVEMLTFRFRVKTKDTNQEASINEQVLQKLKNLRLSETQIKQVMREVGTDDIIKTCYEINVQVNNFEVKNPGGYTWSIFTSKFDLK